MRAKSGNCIIVVDKQYWHVERLFYYDITVDNKVLRKVKLQNLHTPHLSITMEEPINIKGSSVTEGVMCAIIKHFYLQMCKSDGRQDNYYVSYDYDGEEEECGDKSWCHNLLKMYSDPIHIDDICQRASTTVKII